MWKLIVVVAALLTIAPALSSPATQNQVDCAVRSALTAISENVGETHRNFLPLEYLWLPTRLHNILSGRGIVNLGDLTDLTPYDILGDGIGYHSLTLINARLALVGLSLSQPQGTTVERSRIGSMGEQRRKLLAIAELKLSVRTQKFLMALGISTIGELMEHSWDDLDLPKTSGEELDEVLEDAGIELPE